MQLEAIKLEQFIAGICVVSLSNFVFSTSLPILPFSSPSIDRDSCGLLNHIHVWSKKFLLEADPYIIYWVNVQILN